MRQWSATPEWELLIQYELLPQKPAPAWYERLYWNVTRRLRVMGLGRARYRKQCWLPGLKHATCMPQGKTLLIWSDVPDKVSSRSACAGMKRLLVSLPEYVPVLVSDLADFAFYSRLGWLVEYLPSLSGEGFSYHERKQRYLAWRYRDAIIIPLSSGFASREEFSILLRDS